MPDRLDIALHRLRRVVEAHPNLSDVWVNGETQSSLAVTNQIELNSVENQRFLLGSKSAQDAYLIVEEPFRSSPNQSIHTHEEEARWRRLLHWFGL